MRLFVALEIPSSVRDNLSAFLSEMRALTERLGEKRTRWVRPENLHVTLKFIGEVADAKLTDIRSALSTVSPVAPIDVRFHGLGFFPDEKSPDRALGGTGRLTATADVCRRYRWRAHRDGNRQGKTRVRAALDAGPFLGLPLA